MKTTVVTTTIHLPAFLTAYSEDALQFGHDVDFIVIGDRKSPQDTLKFCQTIPNCLYMDIDSQREYMQRFPELWYHLPFDSVERRMIGILRAYETGCDVTVTIDDDNLLATNNVFQWYKSAGFGHKQNLPTYSSTSGWFNVCAFLEEENDITFYHRGYSPRNKWKGGYTSANFERHKVVVNAGLWYNDPDTDAITRLERPLNVVGLKDVSVIALAPGTYSPFNCQNTAIAREAIPAYFMSPYIGRHADIFASYVITRLAEHFNDVIAFGMPLANHARDTYPHNLWRDLDLERWGMLNTDFFCDTLRSVKLTAKTYHEGFGQIIEQLKDVKWPVRSGLYSDTESFEMVEGMQIWHDVFKRIL